MATANSEDLPYNTEEARAADKEMVSDGERVDEEIIEEREIISDIERVDEEIIEEREIIPGYPCVRCS